MYFVTDFQETLNDVTEEILELGKPLLQLIFLSSTVLTVLSPSFGAWYLLVGWGFV